MSAALQPQSDSVDSPFPFLRLPLEVQLRVCSLLCRHCRSRPSSPSVTLYELAGTCFKTLKALSETCHALKRIAQPILYHYPDVHTYTPFFKTVIARPELATSVRVFARVYESDWTFTKRGPPRYSKEDYQYLIKLGQSYALNDGDGEEYADDSATDDSNFMRCFRYLEDAAVGDQIGDTRMMALQSFFSLLTALHFIILPRLEFAMINLYDGMEDFGATILNSGQLGLPYPYLAKAIAAKPENCSHLDTIVFRSPTHYQPDTLGLERVAFLFPAIPNVRVAMFEALRGEQPYAVERPQHQHAHLVPELRWPALSHLEEVYFEPCMRRKLPVPLTAISNMVQRCSSLKKLVYHHKFPDQYKPALFSPERLLEAILPSKDMLLHLELRCSLAKIPSLASGTLLSSRLREFALLTTLALDEELFCHHWLSEASQDSCLVNILPKSVSALTVRLHDKFKAMPDIVRLGQEASLGRYSRLSRVCVHVVDDVSHPDDPYNLNDDPDAFDNTYFLHAIDLEHWTEALQELVDKTKPTIVQAFKGTDVTVEVKYANDMQSASRHWYGI